MNTKEQIMTDTDRYYKATHAMQTGVSVVMQYDKTECDPKHLRVGVNSAMVEHSALVELLVDKGVITLEEFMKYLANAMEKEAQHYQEEVSVLMGNANITLE